jgi:predicted nucleotidyltransferase
MPELKNLNFLAKPVKDAVEAYCGKMLEIHGDNLKSMYVYGSAASDEFIARKSDINILVILERVGPEDLKKTLALVKSGFRKRISAPLMLTIKHICSSADVFPLEYFELKDNNLLLYGEDTLSTLEIKPENLRLQCEQQLKGSLVRLRQSYLETGLKGKETVLLMERSITSLMPVFRGILRLKGKTPPTKKRQVISDLGRELSINPSSLDRVMDLKEGRKTLESHETIFRDYSQTIENLGMVIDSM